MGAFGAQIKAINLYGTGHEALKNTDIEARATILNVTLDGYFSGRDASIICRSGDECNVYCIGYGCSGANFYCYSGATCFYDCEETPDHCPTLIGGVDSSLSDTEIHQIYLDNKQSHAVKSNEYPRDGFFADVNPKNVGLNTLFTAQTLGLMAGCLFVGLSLGLCAFNCKNLMKGEKNFDFKNNKLEFN